MKVDSGSGSDGSSSSSDTTKADAGSVEAVVETESETVNVCVIPDVYNDESYDITDAEDDDDED